MGDPGLVGAIVVGIAFLLLTAAVGRRKNKSKTRNQRISECFEEYDRKMEKFRR
ncbi:hypothetical protein [Adlercreutzia equolifaciens]|uniref:hypothetical protein n=1 Tax=Adlercreutzia equolifaciens TaxID=446660 RepID=UPI003A8ABB1C